MIDAAHIARKTFFAVGRGLRLRALAPRALAGVGGILMLHRVSPVDPSPLGIHAGLCIKPRFLNLLVVALKDAGYDFIAMDDVPARIANPTGKPFLAVTFDDGYKDNAEYAYPILHRHNVPWTVYIAPGLVSGETHLWWEIAEQAVASLDHLSMASPNGRLTFKSGSANEKTAAFRQLEEHITTGVPEAQVPVFTRELAVRAGLDAIAHNKTELMDWNEIRMISCDPLCTIGSHTWGHHFLARLDEAALKHEFYFAQSAIEMETGVRPKHIAYPYGYRLAVDARETEFAKAFGYNTGVTTRHGLLFPEHRQSMTALPRISVNGKHQNVGDVKLMLSGLTSWLAHRHGGAVTL